MNFCINTAKKNKVEWFHFKTLNERKTTKKKHSTQRKIDWSINPTVYRNINTIVFIK